MTNRRESNQYDLFAARKARDAALETVGKNAGETWNAAALSRINDLSGLVTGEDIRVYLEPIIGAPHDQHAWGFLIREAKKRELLIWTGIFRPMRTKKSHARITPVYQVSNKNREAA